MTDFNLSEKIGELSEVEYCDSMADVQGDVSNIFKEFIRQDMLLICLFLNKDIDEKTFWERRDKLVGDKLCLKN